MIYGDKTVGYMMGYIWKKLWDIFEKIMRYIWQKLRDALDKIMGYIRQKLRDIPWDIFVNNYGIY